MRYPEAPGHKGDLETGKDAAREMQSEAGTLRASCLATLERGDFTADEIAQQLGRDILSIRPRISELRLKGKVYPTDLRRPNASGKNAAANTRPPRNASRE